MKRVVREELGQHPVHSVGVPPRVPFPARCSCEHLDSLEWLEREHVGEDAGLNIWGTGIRFPFLSFPSSCSKSKYNYEGQAFPCSFLF